MMLVPAMLLKIAVATLSQVARLKSGWTIDTHIEVFGSSFISSSS